MTRSADETTRYEEAATAAAMPTRAASPDAQYALRRYEPHDEDAAVALWLRTWQATYPELDFAGRLDWWRKRWRRELLPAAEVVIAEAGDAVVGFVTVDPRTLYLDQIVVAPERWGSGIGRALIAQAKRISPAGLDLDVNTDNARAIRFYGKQGFVTSGAGVNPISGKPVQRMSWRPAAQSSLKPDAIAR